MVETLFFFHLKFYREICFEKLVDLKNYIQIKSIPLCSFHNLLHLSFK